MAHALPIVPLPVSWRGIKRKRSEISPREGSGADERDRCLMDRVRTGDEEAFRQLFDTYWEPLVGYAAMIIGAGDDCEDVALQAFVRVWRHRTKWAGNGAVRPYLYRITRNLALNARRDRLVRDARQRTTQLIEGDANHHRTPAQHLEAACLRREVRVAIDLLPERRRDAFVLSRFHGLSHHEIADTLGISSQTVANHLSAAMADLRITLAHHLTDA